MIGARLIDGAGNRVGDGAGIGAGAAKTGPAGSRVIVERNHDLPIARFGYTLLTGASDDPPGREGLASFAIELACRGAGGRSREAIDEAVEQLGADLLPLADADSVGFELEVLSEHLDETFALLADILLRPDLDGRAAEEEAEKLRREMHAALDDLRDDDGRIARRMFARHLYGAHPYGRPTGGTAESIDWLTAREARRFLERAVAGGNLITSAAGDVEPARFHRLLDRRLGVLRSGAPPRPSLAHPARAPGEPRLLLVDKPERTQSQIVLGQRAVSRADPDFLPLSVAVSAFGGTFTSRLTREVRVKRGLSYGASAALGQGRGARAASMAMAPEIGRTVETLELVLGLWREFVDAGLSDEEIAFAKDHLAGGFAFHVATPEDRVDARVALEVFELPADELDRMVDLIRALEPGDVRAAMARHLHPSDLAVTVVTTAAEILAPLRKSRLFSPGAIEVVPFDSY